jgi:flavin-dependent dehydrogenase
MFDAIVVGARCAGAPTAMLLARKGYRVLLIDQTTFPSDHVLSTHLVWQPGIACLDRWGLLPQIVASGCPALSAARLDVGPVVLHGRLPPADGGAADAYAPRRTVLDDVLVQGAIAAGAELREGCRMTGVMTDEQGNVCGVSVRSRRSSHTERASLVIGADGMRSSVAEFVRAPAYATHPPLQGTYFTYWHGVPIDGIDLSVRPNRVAYGWPTNDALVLIGVNWPAREYGTVRGDVEQSYLTALQEVAPHLAERVRDGRRVARWIGGSVPNYLRRPHGVGWALVGDAGYHKDPITAQGISDAFRDAELLADAVDLGLSGRHSLGKALAGYEHSRNEAAMAMYEFTCQMARLDPPSPEMAQLYTCLRGNDEQISRFLGVIAGTIPVQQFFSPENLESIVRVAGARANGAAQER